MRSTLPLGLRAQGSTPARRLFFAIFSYYYQLLSGLREIFENFSLVYLLTHYIRPHYKRNRTTAALLYPLPSYELSLSRLLPLYALVLYPLSLFYATGQYRNRRETRR